MNRKMASGCLTVLSPNKKGRPSLYTTGLSAFRMFVMIDSPCWLFTGSRWHAALQYHHCCVGSPTPSNSRCKGTHFHTLLPRTRCRSLNGATSSTLTINLDIMTNLGDSEPLGYYYCSTSSSAVAPPSPGPGPVRGSGSSESSDLQAWKCHQPPNSSSLSVGRRFSTA